MSSQHMGACPVVLAMGVGEDRVSPGASGIRKVLHLKDQKEREQPGGQGGGF